MEKAWKNIAQVVKKGQRVGVAVSGGADSVYLLHAFLSADNIDKEQILVVNIEHGIRGERSVEDSRFVGNLAQKYDLDLAFFSVSVPERRKESGRSEETEARIARKEKFDELIRDGRVDLIATAHHADDKVEGILMHLLRGCGTTGLVGMQMQWGPFIRPLIDTTKKEIEKYLTDNGIEFVVDETNFDTHYNRNFIRHSVIPTLCQRYDISGAINQLSKSAQADEEYFRSVIDERNFIVGKTGEIGIKSEVFDLPIALSSRYILLATEKIGRRVDFESKHIYSVIELSGKDNGKMINLTDSLVAIKEYDRITLFIESDASESEEIQFEVGFTSFMDGFITVMPADAKVVGGTLKLDADKVPMGSVIRTRRVGDTFKPYGGGTKKLKDYLIDKKIAFRNRDKLPLLCYNNKVLAIFGVEIADEVKITDSTVSAVEIGYSEN